MELIVETPSENVRNFALEKKECKSFLDQIFKELDQEESGIPAGISSERSLEETQM